MPNLVIIAGSNGSGKSTAAPALLQNAVHINNFVNADVIAKGLSAGYRFHLVFLWLNLKSLLYPALLKELRWEVMRFQKRPLDDAIMQD